MAQEVKEELVITYNNDYNEFVDDFPNRLAPLVSDIHELNIQLIKKMNKFEKWSQKMAKTKNKDKKIEYSKSVQKYAKKIKDIGDQKIEISSLILKLVKAKGKLLKDDHEMILLCDQEQPFTYGTRSGNVWTH